MMKRLWNIVKPDRRLVFLLVLVMLMNLLELACKSTKQKELPPCNSAEGRALLTKVVEEWWPQNKHVKYIVTKIVPNGKFLDGSKFCCAEVKASAKDEDGEWLLKIMDIFMQAESQRRHTDAYYWHRHLSWNYSIGWLTDKKDVVWVGDYGESGSCKDEE
jgi:hypothetical protein